MNLRSFGAEADCKSVESLTLLGEDEVMLLVVATDEQICQIDQLVDPDDIGEYTWVDSVLAPLARGVKRRLTNSVQQFLIPELRDAVQLRDLASYALTIAEHWRSEEPITPRLQISGALAYSALQCIGDYWQEYLADTTDDPVAEKLVSDAVAAGALPERYQVEQY